ncbi:MAG: replication-associated recombination protein A [Ruminococcaceae bacterium]|nr:replication-associated recombination protein A [Oscillospiraceae bacterium]
MSYQPLADKIRPKTIDDIVGQEHLFGPRGTIRAMLERGRITNMIFSGPPGTGKTTAASIIAGMSDKKMFRLNATTASLSDVKAVAEETKTMFGADGVLLYLDEIQYFNRKQQQSLLEYLEDGRITLIASTTENPYFAIYNALISRSSVFEFKPVPPIACARALRRAWEILDEDEGVKKEASDELLLRLAECGGGDVRRSLGILENAYALTDGVLTEETVSALTPSFTGNFDVSGDVHYDMLSCLQKSIRGSDVQATMFYLAKILAGGDLLSVCRRLQVIASEDVGNAYPLAAVVTRACVESARDLGLPEAALPLANAAAMLATAPKSNAAHDAYFAALKDVEAGRGTVVPEHLQSPLFKGYKYPHEYPNHFVSQQYLPDDLKTREYYKFGTSKTEQAAKAYYDMIRGKK